MRKMGRGLAQFATPIVYGDRVIVGSGRGGVAAYTLQGKRLWQTKTQAPVHAPIGAAPDRIVAVDAKGMAYALDAASGHEIWHATLDCEVMGAPLVMARAVYVACARGDLLAMAVNNGEVLWRTSPRLVATTFSTKGGSGPAWADGRVIVGYVDGKVAAHAAENGGLIWETRIAPRTAALQDVDGTPIIANGRVFAASASGNLSALDSKTGRVLWQMADLGTVNPVLAANGLIYAAGRGIVAAIDAASGTVRWRTDLHERELSAPVLLRQQVVLATTSGQLITLDPTDGHRIAMRKLDGTYGQPLVVADRLYLATNNNRIWALE